MTARGLTLEQRFQRYVKVGKADECWNWTGATNGVGYGKITYEGGLLQAHFLAYYFSGQKRGNGDCILHLCNNSLCCNPKHLVAGSKRENSLHAVATGKHHNTGGPIPGVSFRFTRNIWMARGNIAGSRLTLYEGKDFFEACCARKSWESRQKRL